MTPITTVVVRGRESVSTAVTYRARSLNRRSLMRQTETSNLSKAHLTRDSSGRVTSAISVSLQQ